MKKLGLVCLVLLLSLTVLGGVRLPVQPVQCSPDMLPADGDAWTENDNATYTWKFHTTYKTNNSMSWTTADVQAGTYALNVTHGQSASFIYFRLVFDQAYDLTNYNAVYFWMKPTSLDTSYGFNLLMHSTDINWDSSNQLAMPTLTYPNVVNDTWQYYCAPFFYFEQSGTAQWTSVRQLYFALKTLDSASGSQFLIDNLHFGTWTLSAMTSPTTAMQTLMGNTWHNFKESQHATTYGGTSYTTQYDYQNLTTNAWEDGSLESEVLAHSLYALALAYNYSSFEFYLTEAETLATFLLQGQIVGGIFDGMFSNSYDDGGTWSNGIGATHNGWIMAGLSVLYAVTSNMTYKTALDDMREAMCGINWNSTYGNTNNGGNNATQTVSYSTGLSVMRDGASLAGLSLYYKHVQQNSTVLNCIHSLETLGTTSLNWNQSRACHSGAWEDNAYFLTGIYWAYQATANSTYRSHFINGTENLLSKMIQQPNLNGSAISSVGYPLQWQKGTLDTMDGWGLHESLHLFYLVNQVTSGSYWINSLERSLFSQLYDSQDDDGGFWRSTASGWTDKQYNGSPAFVQLGLQLYNREKSTDLYVVGSSATVSTIQETTGTFTFTLSDTGTSTTYVYCGSHGQPVSVSGATSWSYDSSTDLLTISVSHASAQEVTVSWEGSVGKYNVAVVCKQGDQFLSGVEVSIQDIKRVTGAGGSASFSLPAGTYTIEATYQGQKETVQVTVVGNQSVTIQFTHQFVPIAEFILILVVIGGGLLFIGRGKLK